MQKISSRRKYYSGEFYKLELRVYLLIFLNITNLFK